MPSGYAGAMSTPRPVVATGQQIGAGWTPALSVVKALAALAAAEARGAEAVFWMADEDHDHLEVTRTVGLTSGRLTPHRFHLPAPAGTATGWLPWTPQAQAEAETLWGELPRPLEATLRSHFETLGAPLWRRGLRAYSPAMDPRRAELQPVLEAWRALNLEAELLRQSERLRAEGAPLPLDPSKQHAWFSLDPATGARRPLEGSDPCPAGHWLSPGATLRPLMQSQLLPVTAVVLGPAERAYWRLCEPLWERVGLSAPEILSRPSVFVVPRGIALEPSQLPALKAGDWGAFTEGVPVLPSSLAGVAPMAQSWEAALTRRVAGAWQRYQQHLQRLDRRALRDLAARQLGPDPERLRQALFPLGRPQERVLPGLLWLRDEALLARMLEGLRRGGDTILVEAP